MKKIVMVMALVLSLSMVLVGCSKSTSYTKEEENYIRIANGLISGKYNVEIKEKDYKYSVGKQSSENEFDKIAEGEEPEVVSVHALSKQLPKEGDMLEYTIIYNTKSKEIIKSEMYLQEGTTDQK
ncbi:MAG: hypothetical protein ACRCXT_16665 [Paraclostridium sp.]